MDITMTPYEGWRFIFDKDGIAYHVPDKELLEKMCELYYKDNKQIKASKE